MSIKFVCPTCQTPMVVPDALAGKRGNCKKCKSPITVPSSPSLSVAAPAPPAPPPSSVNGNPPPQSPPPEVLTNAEEEAARALADEQAQEQQAPERLEFNCPQCDEPLSLPLDLAGKRHPCPSCTRIIKVPDLQPHQKKTWRDTGPKLPVGARKLDEPAPEGAWGTATRTGPSREALIEAGVIDESPRKPATLLQRWFPYLLLGSPVILLLIGGLVAWSWWARNKEKRAFTQAMTFADSDAANESIGLDGRAALYANAGRYYLRSGKNGSAPQAREQFGKAVGVIANSRSLSCIPLLIDVSESLLDLGGDGDAVADETHLKWADTQKMLSSSLRAIRAPQARFLALRRVLAGLVKRGESSRVLALTNQVYADDDADKTEALAIAGLALHAGGKKKEADSAFDQIEAIFKRKGARPALRAPVVTLAMVLERKLIDPAKTLDDRENALVGKVAGLARAGQLSEARSLAESAKEIHSTTPFIAYVALIEAASDTKGLESEDITRALEMVPESVNDRRNLTWVMVRLIRAGIDHGTSRDKLDTVAGAIPFEPITQWQRFLLFRAGLKDAGSVGEDALESLPESTVAGLAARLEMARHNTRRNNAWASTIDKWEPGPRAFGSLGVALALQGGK